MINVSFISLQVEISDFHSIANGTTSGMSAPEFLEKEPVGLVPGIEIKNLKKVFNSEKGLQLTFIFSFLYNVYFILKA